MFRKGTRRPAGAGLSLALLAAAGGLAAGCGHRARHVPPGRRHRTRGGGQSPPGARDGPATGPNLLAWPPFGPDVHIVMPGWLPPAPATAARRSSRPRISCSRSSTRNTAGIRTTGGRGYVSGPVRGALESNLAEPDVTTESFTGTIIFSHLSAFPDPTEPGAIDVSECFDNARSANTSLATGKIVPDHSPANQHYYLNTDVLALRNGQWRVISVDPVIYYPQARECKP